MQVAGEVIIFPENEKKWGQTLARGGTVLMYNVHDLAMHILFVPVFG